VPDESSRSVNSGRWLRPRPAAEYIGHSESRLAKLRLYGGGPPFVKSGRTVLYDVNDLDSWLESLKRRSTSELAT